MKEYKNIKIEILTFNFQDVLTDSDLNNAGGYAEGEFGEDEENQG